MIIWLASYPKSGNTWLRAILHQIVVNKTEKEETWISNLHKLVDTYPKIQHFQDLNSSLVEGTDFKNKSEIIRNWDKSQKRLSSDKKLRILIITGVGKTFSAGADLDWMKSAKNLSLEENKKDALYFSEMLKKIDEFPKPTLALINGHAFGGGLGIISACDFSLAEENAKFCFSCVNV